MARRCPHPHRLTPVSRWWEAEYAKYPTDPDDLPETTLLLEGETGFVPYSGANNPRGRAAQRILGERHLAAGTAVSWTVARLDLDRLTRNPYDPHWDITHLVLIAALAEVEGRYCVVDWCKAQIASRMFGPWLSSETTA